MKRRKLSAQHISIVHTGKVKRGSLERGTDGWELHVRTRAEQFVFAIPPQYVSSFNFVANAEQEAVAESAHTDPDYLGGLPHYLTAEAQASAEEDWAGEERELREEAERAVGEDWSVEDRRSAQAELNAWLKVRTKWSRR